MSNSAAICSHLCWDLFTRREGFGAAGEIGRAAKMSGDKCPWYNRQHVSLIYYFLCIQQVWRGYL
jgi:hypothetical protein